MPLSRDDDSFSPDPLQADATSGPGGTPQPGTNDIQDSSDPGSVIFVGGLGDQNSAIVYKEYERFKFARPDVASRYFSHDENRAIGNYIKTLSDDAPVTLIGHSWGGDTAAQVALNLPKRITTLITVDPVGNWTPWLHSYDSIANSVGRWIDVDAESSGEPTFGDSIARLGRWGTGPAGAAHNFFSLDEHHDNFSHMLNQVKSYQDLITPKPMGAR